MKNLIQFLNEAKYYTLTDDERDSLAVVVGILSGATVEDEYNEKLDPLKKELSKEELKQLDSLYDFLDDEQTYPKVNRNNLKPDADLVIKIINWIDDNDAYIDNNDVELIDILDKLTYK